MVRSLVSACYALNLRNALYFRVSDAVFCQPMSKRIPDVRKETECEEENLTNLIQSAIDNWHQTPHRG